MNDQHCPSPLTHPDPDRRAPLFPLGAVVATPGAIALLRQHDTNPFTLLQRHVRGDWGELCAEDRIANERAVHGGGRIFSSYAVGSDNVWVITEAVTDAGTRQSTCVLLPQEY
jgi:hypothetical protein